MNSKKSIILAAVCVSLSLAACGRKQAENPYGNIVAGLGDEEAYAFLVTDNDYNIMVTSDFLYDEGTESQASIFCDVYYYSSGEAEKVGSIMSEGTAYPVTFSRDGIFAASGHSVEKYVISDKDGTLVLKKGVYENFDESGNADYISMENGKETAATEEAYLAVMEEYSKSQVIHFSYGAGGCVNEIMKFTKH